jgi:coenzyme F420-dependent glucose-6-phosphate dehydrogenase
MSWAETDEAALDGSREWKGTLVVDNYSDDIHDPAEVGRRGADVSDTKWKLMAAVSSDPATHVRKIKAMSALGATAVAVMNVSGADPHGALRTYSSEVLPKLRE